MVRTDYTTSKTIKTENDIPKIIWFMWYQGAAEMPSLVQKCLESFKTHNPDWDIRFLDKENISTFISLPAHLTPGEDITFQAYSDIVRVNLLQKYGGLWVDATVFCTQPLDDWLHEYTKEGFFTFQEPPDGFVASWFLVSKPEEVLLSTWTTNINQYWKGYVFPIFWQKVYQKIGFRLLFWNRSWFLRKTYVMSKRFFGLYPYFWMHYILFNLRTEDKKCNEKWKRIPVYSSDIPHTLIFYGLQKPLNNKMKDHIDKQKSPVYKLTWKGISDVPKDTTLHYLLHTS